MSDETTCEVVWLEPLEIKVGDEVLVTVGEWSTEMIVVEITGNGRCKLKPKELIDANPT